jgi:hypothetical protein
MLHMRNTYSFNPSKRAYQTQFKRWGFPSKRKPTLRDNGDLLERVKELWEANYSQRNMLQTLQAEGHDIKERELMRLRAKNRWLMRIPNGAKQAPGDDTLSEAQIEAQLLSAAQDEEAASQEVAAEAVQAAQAAQAARVPEPDEPPVEFLQRQQERLSELQAISDQRWAEKKRRRRTKGYAGLPADPAGMPPRFPSETTLEESRKILGLAVKEYRAVRDRFQTICEEENIMQKTVAGAEKWQAVKNRLIGETPILQSKMWPDDPNKQSKELALDVICTDVTKRIRTMGKRLTILESKNVLGLNPDQSRQIRSEFYAILESEHYTSKLEMGPEKWKELKDRWIANNTYLLALLAPGPENDSEHKKKLDAMELLCRDVMKRVRDDRAKKKGTFRKSRPADSEENDVEAMAQVITPAPAPVAMATSYTAAQPATPFGDLSMAASQNDLTELQIDPNLLQAADDLGAPQVSTLTPVYIRPHPESTMYTNTKLWLGSLANRTVPELRALLADRYPSSIAERIDGVEKDAGGNEIPYRIDEDEELDAYLDHVQTKTKKATFVVLLKAV